MLTVTPATTLRLSERAWTPALPIQWQFSLEPIKRQFLDFGKAIETGGKPLVAGEEGYAALKLTLGIYESARNGRKVTLH